MAGLQTPEIEEIEYDGGRGGYTSSPTTPRTPHTTNSTAANSTPLPKLNFDEKHRLLKLRLTPLRHVQRDLEVRLGAGAEEPAPALAGAATTEAAPFGGTSSSASAGRNAGLGPLGPAGAVTGGVLSGGMSMTPYFVPPSRRGPQEFYVRSSTGWKAALERLRPPGSGRSSTDREREGNIQDAKNKREREAEETTRVIAGCREDIGALWGDEVVRTILARRRLRLEEGGGL